MRKILFAAFLAFAFTPQAYGFTKDDILGVWDSEQKDAKIEVFHCGESYCGKIVWLKVPLYPAGDPSGREGKPKVDLKNQDASLKERPLLGLEFMEGFVFAGANTWEKGHIYDPKSGRTYKGKITMVSRGQLNLKGYIGIPLLGRSSTWTR